MWGILLAVMVVLIELFSWGLWNLVLDGDRKIELYREKMASARSYAFDSTAQIIGVEPGTTVTAYSSEFVDRYGSAVIPPLDVATFDDGLDPDRPVKVLVFGDSFARGVGSIDALENNWVEQAEKWLPGVDLINFGGQGSPAQRQQLTLYRRLVGLVEHDAVLLSLWSGNDFLENRSARDLNVVLSQLPDPDRAISLIQVALNYDAGCEALAKDGPVSWTALLAGRLLPVIPGLPPELVRLLPGCPSTATAGTKVPEEVAEGRRLYREYVALAEDADTVTGNHTDFGPDRLLWRDDLMHHIPPHFFDRQLAAELAAEAVRWIEEIVDVAEKAGKRVFLVVHPTKADLYLTGAVPVPEAQVPPMRAAYISLKSALGLALGGSNQQSMTPEEGERLDPAHARESLVKALQGTLPVLDLTEALRARAATATGPYYWPIDAHYNPEGYRAAAEEICVALGDWLMMSDKPACAAPIGKEP